MSGTDWSGICEHWCRSVTPFLTRSKGILHLNIKAKNVMIGHFGEVFLIDWGVAMMLDFSGQRCKAQGLCYWDPQPRGPRDVSASRSTDPKTDVFLLGVTLHGAPPSLDRLISGGGDTQRNHKASVLKNEVFHRSKTQRLKQICARAIEAKSR